jgi:hypothetical protein
VRAGHEDRRRALPAGARQGPGARFIRDFVDSRFSFVELMIPLLIVTMVMGYSGNRAWPHRQHDPVRHAAPGRGRHAVLRFRLRRELTRRFPDEPLKGRPTTRSCAPCR